MDDTEAAEEGGLEDELEQMAQARLGRTLCDKWTLERVLGIGGMATVYGGRHRNGKQVAIKMLHPQLSLSATLKKRFLREGYVANAVNHPNAIGADDDDVDDDGSAFLVMDFLEGVSLEDHVEAVGGMLSIAEAVPHAITLLDVLACAHENQIVHRDIKPANLFITTDGELKVLDFGVARVRESPAFSKVSMTQSGSVIGTPAFMAPEQAAGRSDEVGPCTDLWAVGATLFSVLSGRLVHDATTMPELMAKAIRDPAPSLREVMPHAPEALVAIIDRALAFAPGDRWPSAAAMRDALRALPKEVLGSSPASAMRRFALAKTSPSDAPYDSAALPSVAAATHETAFSTAGGAHPAELPVASRTPFIAAAIVAVIGIGLAIAQPWSRAAPASEPAPAASTTPPADTASDPVAPPEVEPAKIDAAPSATAAPSQSVAKPLGAPLPRPRPQPVVTPEPLPQLPLPKPTDEDLMRKRH